MCMLNAYRHQVVVDGVSKHAARILALMPRSPPRYKAVQVNGKTLKLRTKKQPSSGSVYKGVTKRGKLFTSYVTRKGIKKYIGSFKEEEDAAMAIATTIDFGVEYEPSPKSCTSPLDPLKGIFDEEAETLKSPESVDSSVFSPKGIVSGNLRASALSGRCHKTLMQSWEEDHGKPFEPTANASTIRIPFSSRL